MDQKVRMAVRVIRDYLNLSDAPEKSSAIFILGGSSLSPVYRAAELFHAGLAPTIAFISIGGRFGGETLWGKPEYEKYREVLLEKGVPPDAIVSAGKSTNTLVEAQQAIPFLREMGIEPKKLILCSRPCHQRRAWATFAKQHADIEYVNCPGDETETMFEMTEITRMIQEMDRLVEYGQKGDIVSHSFSDEIQDALDIIRAHQPSP